MLTAVSELLASVEEHLLARREELLSSTQALLQSVETRLETCRELRRLRGENFNVFQLLQLDGKEDAHSRFIAELLDPSGSHDQGDAFLKLFLERIGELAWTDGSRRTAAKEWIQAGNVEREKYIGPVVTDRESPAGGRIDIVISDHERGHHLSIENKIGSGEGEKQVTRYCNFQPDQNFVLFLTLDGQDADTAKPNYRSISYTGDILPWLESCQRQAKDFPILWGTIKQYIIMVKRLTGGLTMDGKIKDAMKQHYKAAWEIRQTFDALVSEQVKDLVEAVQKQIKAQGLGWDMRPPPKPPGIALSQHGKEAQVIWQHGWVGISVSGQSPFDYEQVHQVLGWSDAKRGPNYPYWIEVPKARFYTEEGIEHLFDESKREQLAKDLAGRLVELANTATNLAS